MDNVVNYYGRLPYRKQDGSIGQFKKIREDAGFVRIGFVDSDRSVSGANANDEGGILTFAQYRGYKDDISELENYYVPALQANAGYLEAEGGVLDFKNGKVSAGNILNLYPNGTAITAAKNAPEMIFSYADLRNNVNSSVTFYSPGELRNIAFFGRKLYKSGKPVYSMSLSGDSNFIDKGAWKEITSSYRRDSYSYDTDLYVKYLAKMVPSNTKKPYTYLASMLGIKSKYSNTEEGWKKLFGNMGLGSNSVFSSDLNYFSLPLFREGYYKLKSLF